MACSPEITKMGFTKVEGKNVLCPGSFDLSRICADWLLTTEGLDAVEPKVPVAFILAFTVSCVLSGPFLASL